MIVRHRTLRVLAALVWYAGGVLLLLKGPGYLLHAAALRSGSPWPWIGGGLGVALGAARGRRAFARACRRNLVRIDALVEPKPWEFFRPGFFVALVAMTGAGIGLRALADGGGFWASVVVGSLELMIAVALLTSSAAFWSRGGAESAEGTRQARDAA